MGYLDIAAGEVGYKGPAENHNKYWAALKPSWQGYPWCFTFVSWCLWKAGSLSAIGGSPLYYCPTGVNLARKRGQWFLKPQAGDLVFWGTNGVSYHVGFVVKVVSGGIETIEGNTSGDYVRRRTRSFNNVMGYWHMTAVPGSGAGGPNPPGYGEGMQFEFLPGQLMAPPAETMDATQHDLPVAWFPPSVIDVKA